MSDLSHPDPKVSGIGDTARPEEWLIKHRGKDCAELKRRAALAAEQADPKELQNDGDPIREATEFWVWCCTCGCRHPRGKHPSDPAAWRKEQQRIAGIVYEMVRKEFPDDDDG